MDKASIGIKIRAARLKLGLSQAEFAERIGTSEKTLSSWERGAYLVDVIMLNTIASVSGLTLNDFTDIPASETEDPTETYELDYKVFEEALDKKKAVYVFFGIREDK